MEYRVPRGTDDILPDEVEKWQWIEAKAREICRFYGFREMRTPLFEHVELFQRGVGETTDIVEKEMYTFTDRADRRLCLRPEGTAGVVRAFVEHKVFAQPPPTKWYYMGPMFRYENPQAGRRRQFHQWGAEVFGSDDPALDAEVITLGMKYLELLGIKGARVEINSVGDGESRLRYREKLIAYFEPYADQLSAEARSRMYRNPLRILDSKDARTQEIAAGAPSILHELNEPSQHHFAKVQQYLELLQIDYVVNDRLVRGLDYYTHTAFEFMVDLMGAQASTIGGGGRYNGLVEEIGGPPGVSGCGFGIGLERVLLALKEQEIVLPLPTGLDCYLVTLGEQAKLAGTLLLQNLRAAGLVADRDYLERKMKAQMKAADRAGARFVAILGDEELAAGKIQLKNLATGQQEWVALEEMNRYLQHRLGEGKVEVDG
jgi:histidyl-tRNA synthetase